jgi:hypothetical protein
MSRPSPSSERSPDRFGLRRSSVRTARGLFRSWIDNASVATGRRPDAEEWLALVGREVVEWQRIWLRALDDVRVEHHVHGDDRLTGVRISGPSGTWQWSMDPSGPYRSFQPWPDTTWSDLARHLQPLGEPAADALLYPGWRYRGLTETGRRTVTSATGRSAIEVDLVPTIPWDDPQAGGVDDWPWDLEAADTIQVIEDLMTGAVLEWRCLLDDLVYRRHW